MDYRKKIADSIDTYISIITNYDCSNLLKNSCYYNRDIFTDTEDSGDFVDFAEFPILDMQNLRINLSSINKFRLYEIAYAMYKSGVKDLKLVVDFLKEDIFNNLLENPKNLDEIKTSFIDSVNAYFEDENHTQIIMKSGRIYFAESKVGLINKIKRVDKDNLLFMLKEFEKTLLVTCDLKKYCEVIIELSSSVTAFIPVLESLKNYSEEDKHLKEQYLHETLRKKNQEEYIKELEKENQEKQIKKLKEKNKKLKNQVDTLLKVLSEY